ncbi:MAG TPA: HD domain-containing protein [Streptosporangiaceae bacterium]|nr:HD domain-containing protein [Streptosporangiaceae bacterium]
MTGAMARRPEPDRMAYWQAVDSGRLLLMAAAAMLVTAAFASTAVIVHQQQQLIDWNAALAFGGLIAFGELLRLALPGAREAAPIAMVGAMSYALLLTVRGERPGVTLPPVLVIAVCAVGMMVGALPHIAAGRPAGVTGMCSRLVAVAGVAFIFRSVVSGFVAGKPWELIVAVMALLIFFGWLIDTVVGALIRADDVGARFAVALVDEIRLQWRLGLAVGASVIITVFSVQAMGLPVLIAFIGPLLVTQVAFRRYAGIRATYLQTVRSLARVTEVAGYVEAGHSRRVSRLAVAVGRGLGMAEPELLALEYAALMHDIGQLSLRDPIPGGATVLVSAADQQRIAELGAEVISQAGVLDNVAHLVRCQAWPARGHDPVPPLGSMIIRAANAFDDMVGSSTDRDRSVAALDRMRLDPVGYDVAVVTALSEVASRRVASRL